MDRAAAMERSIPFEVYGVGSLRHSHTVIQEQDLAKTAERGRAAVYTPTREAHW